jgi:hypothetical protein
MDRHCRMTAKPASRLCAWSAGESQWRLSPVRREEDMWLQWKGAAVEQCDMHGQNVL